MSTGTLAPPALSIQTQYLRLSAFEDRNFDRRKLTAQTQAGVLGADAAIIENTRQVWYGLGLEGLPSVVRDVMECQLKGLQEASRRLRDVLHLQVASVAVVDERETHEIALWRKDLNTALAIAKAGKAARR